MANTKIQDFFNRRFFVIPKYQRGYAWDKSNVRDLFNDIKEATEANSTHYLGTIVLSKSNQDRTVFVVDGQQRITTLTIIINALIDEMSADDKSFYRRLYISENSKYRLRLLNQDSQYFECLLKGELLNPTNKSQRALLDSYTEIKNQVKLIEDKVDFLSRIENLEILQFVQESEGDAIRIFQTVNDRGKPLSNMEKAKSLLIYFSNRYLDKDLDDIINSSFGDIFQLYDQVKFTGEDLGVRLIASDKFTEDTIMRYHFITFCNEDYDASAEYVLSYLKRELGKLRKENNIDATREFINSYVATLVTFFDSLKNIVDKIKTNRKYFKIFSILNLSATLYPLVVRLESLKKLDLFLPDKDYELFTFLDLIELIDVRIYKTRGTDPRAEISRFVYDISADTKNEDIQNWLLWYNERWMNKPSFQNQINGYIYGNRALPHIFIEYSEYTKKQNFSLEELKKMVKESQFNLTIEHVLSQTPNFTLKSHGFRSTEQYLEYEDSIGNLTVLEKRLNSAAQNKSVIDKIKYYDQSIFKMTTELASQLSAKLEFKKIDIEERGTILSEYIVNRWWCRE